MNYLPTFVEQWPHSGGYVGTYSLHGSYGYVLFEFKIPECCICEVPSFFGWKFISEIIGDARTSKQSDLKKTCRR